MKNFNIKQLYYPYRSILNDLKNKNENRNIIPIFICKSDDIIYIWIYKFNNIYDMTTLELEKFYSYKVKIINKK